MRLVFRALFIGGLELEGSCPGGGAAGFKASPKREAWGGYRAVGRLHNLLCAEASLARKGKTR